MIEVIVVFPQAKDGQGIRNLLMRNGYQVGAVCTSGAQAKAYMDNIDYGIVVCGYKFADMMYRDLYEDMGQTFEMLLLASRQKLQEGVPVGIVCVEMPLKSFEFMITLERMMSALERIKKKNKQKPKERNASQKAIIDRAKELLMKKRHYSEEEAHRYIQKASMENGTKMIETAQMILQLMD